MTENPPDIPGLEYERLLGSGGYSDVYLYRQHLPMRQVAVKVLKDSGLGEGIRNQLTAEANAMAGLADHPFIVPVISAAISADGRPYIVMTYYSRPNLSARASSEPLAVSEVLRIGIQIASAVETAHRAGVLHRDIKPANLLINSYGAPGLSDFGIAGTMMDTGETSDDETEIGVSVPWAPPEVLYATAPTSVRSDVYSLAATLWHLLVGRSPFEVRGGDNSAFELMRRIRDVPPPSTARPDVPDSLNRLLRQAMAKDPAVRVGTAIDFARSLQGIELELQLPRTEITVLGDRIDRRPVAPPPSGPGERTGSRTSPGSGTDGRNGFGNSAGDSFAGGARGYPSLPPGHPSGPAPDRLPAAASLPGAFGAPAGAHPSAETSGVFRPAPPTVARPANFRSQPTPPVFTGGRPESPAETERVAARSRHGLLAGVAAAVVAAGLVVGGALLVGGNSSSPKPSPSVSSSVDGSQDAVLPDEDVQPGPVTITGKRTGGKVVFSWTYTSAQSTDSFQVRDLDTGRIAITTRPTLTLTAHSKAPVCIEVRVKRNDGSNASPSFSPKGCA